MLQEDSPRPAPATSSATTTSCRLIAVTGLEGSKTRLSILTAASEILAATSFVRASESNTSALPFLSLIFGVAAVMQAHARAAVSALEHL